MAADSPRAFIDRSTVTIVLGVGASQIVGWGTTFLMPSVLGRHVGADLGLPSEVVFAGITVMFAVSAFIAPTIGRRVDRLGARGVMATGSILAAAALALLSQSIGAITYFVAWVAVGLATSLMLQTAPMAAIAQVAGAGARRAIALVTILGGLASTVFWPLGSALEAALGWRGTLLVYAGLHLALCLPIHLLVLPRSPAMSPRITATGSSSGATHVLSERHRAFIFPLLAATLALSTLVYFGLTLQMIEIMRHLGHSAATAVFVASFIGPAQVSTRAIEVFSGNRVSVMDLAIVSSVTLPISIVMALFAGATIEGAIATAFLFGIANGLKSVVQAALPLALFGHRGYGTLMGRLAVSQNIVAAAAPIVFAALVARAGVSVALSLAIAAALLALAAQLALRRLTGSGRG